MHANAKPDATDTANGITPEVDVTRVVEHIREMLFNPRPPVLTPALAAIPGFTEVHAYIEELRKLLSGCVKGDFSAEVKMRGMLAGMIKSLQANMLHLIWKMEQVRSGDLSQRVDFMGEFSVAFNHMVEQLDDALTKLRLKEEELIAITRELQAEVEKRGAALSALRKSEEQLKYLAEHDPLTGLLNRRSFFARAEMEMARSAIMDTPCAIGLMDIDNFKRFNDTMGHQAGDAALRHVAEVGAALLRDSDILGRYGGEEFILLFGGATLEQARGAAERMRAKIASTPLVQDGKELFLTASFGVTTVPPGTELDGELNVLEFAVGLADSAMYQAKFQGRNRVCVKEFPAQ